MEVRLSVYPYFLLVLIPFFIQFFLKTNNKCIIAGNPKRALTGENSALLLFFILFLGLLAVRSETVGRDLGNYKVIFNTIGRASIDQIAYGVTEKLFKLYTWMIYNYISNNYQIYLAITAVITVIPIAYVYYKDKSHGYLKIAVFVNMSTFIMLFSGIRQGLAMGMGMLAYQALKEHKNWRFLVWAIVAANIHHTGFMVFFLLPLYKLNLSKKHLIWIIPSAGFVVLFNNRIFNYIASIMGETNGKYSALAGSTGAFGSFVLFFLFAAFVYLVSDDETMDEETFALRNILVFATVMQSFAALNPLAMRMNYYFILLIPIALGKGLCYVKPKYKQVAKFAEIVMCVFFTFLFFFSTYRSYVTGISTLDTIPYVPFWKEN